MENFTKKLKVFFGKVKAKAVEIFKIVKEWVIAHKVPSIIIASVLAVAIILAIVLPIALGNKCEKGEHKLEAGEVTAPTCTEEGYTTYTCAKKKCDYTEKKDIVAALGHTWNEGTVTTAPTCTAAGVKTFACTVENCDGTKTEAIAATGEHTSVDVEAVAPTCTTAGATAGKMCSVCEAVLEGIEVVPATGEHIEEDLAAVAPTCTETGLTAGKKCSVCGTVTVAQEEIAINADAHTFAATEETVITADGVFYVEACACGATQNGTTALENYIVLTENNIVEIADKTMTFLDGDISNKTVVIFGDVNFGVLCIRAYDEARTVENVTIITAGDAKADALYIAYVHAHNADLTVNNLTLDGVAFTGNETAIHIASYENNNTNVTVDTLTIKNVDFKMTSEAANLFFFATANTDVGTAVTIKDVVIDNCNIEGTTSNAICVQSAIENITVSNCNFKNIGGRVVYVLANGGQAGDVVVTGNTVDTYGKYFVRMDSITSGTITVKDNTLANAQGAGTLVINVENTVVSATEVTNNTLDGVALTAEQVNVPAVVETPDAGENEGTENGGTENEGTENEGTENEGTENEGTGDVE